MGDSPPRRENIGPDSNEGKSYALSGKIMLSAIVILFFVVLLMVCLHLYARWYLSRARRRQIPRSRNYRRARLVFYDDHAIPGAGTVVSPGLEDSVIKSLPVFAYSSKTHSEPVECAVCLSEFEDGEKGRILPKCNHSFHIDCIDMWFLSHSTCPLCRAPVEAPSTVDEVVITVSEPGSGSGSSSGLCAECENEGEERDRNDLAISSSSSSVGLRRKPSFAGVTIEAPGAGRNESFDESNCDSPSTQSSFRSPVSRMLSFKRMLSRDRKAGIFPSSGIHGDCSSTTTTDIELERGGREETQGLGDVGPVQQRSYPKPSAAE
ncbi:hypothetical protein L6164_012519 [Bauhinia variegata]|uniref:Uncharacterized protein n=1 Tax=Bauhinia variegata TaxID=167791 RepID=A0ACB9PD62_BAUVA|nr:hypothetical protein L6164_012519 [Bauhinia variegata]